jgi:hypothetical protein
MTVIDERKGECQGRQDKCTLGEQCPKFGALGRESRDGKRRVKGCGDPVARGKRNRAKGDAKARVARKRLGIGGANTRHEELWGGALRLEVKAGAQISPVVTRYRSAEAQSEPHRAFGDVRPFVLVCMPDGESDGIAVMRLSVLAQLVSLAIDTGHID